MKYANEQKPHSRFANRHRQHVSGACEQQPSKFYKVDDEILTWLTSERDREWSNFRRGAAKMNQANVSNTFSQNLTQKNPYNVSFLTCSLARWTLTVFNWQRNHSSIIDTKMPFNRFRQNRTERIKQKIKKKNSCYGRKRYPTTTLALLSLIHQFVFAIAMGGWKSNTYASEFLSPFSFFSLLGFCRLQLVGLLVFGKFRFICSKIVWTFYKEGRSIPFNFPI